MDMNDLALSHVNDPLYPTETERRELSDRIDERVMNPVIESMAKAYQSHVVTTAHGERVLSGWQGWQGYGDECPQEVHGDTPFGHMKSSYDHDEKKLLSAWVAVWSPVYNTYTGCDLQGKQLEALTDQLGLTDQAVFIVHEEDERFYEEHGYFTGSDEGIQEIAANYYVKPRPEVGGPETEEEPDEPDEDGFDQGDDN
jgi:hypothetical protein